LYISRLNQPIDFFANLIHDSLQVSLNSIKPRPIAKNGEQIQKVFNAEIIPCRF